MKLQTQLNKIENRLKKKSNNLIDGYKSLIKMESWKYDIGNKDVVTLQEWEEYKQKELNSGTTAGELKELENKIRSKDGFMELNVILDPDLPK